MTTSINKRVARVPCWSPAGLVVVYHTIHARMAVHVWYDIHYIHARFTVAPSSSLVPAHQTPGAKDHGYEGLAICALTFKVVYLCVVAILPKTEENREPILCRRSSSIAQAKFITIFYSPALMSYKCLLTDANIVAIYRRYLLEEPNFITECCR